MELGLFRAETSKNIPYRVSVQQLGVDRALARKAGPRHDKQRVGGKPQETQ